MTTSSEKLPSLEDSLTEMTQLIQRMENGDLTLEQSLAQFERGIALIRHSQKLLESAEQKVQMLIQSNQESNLVDFVMDKEEGVPNEDCK